MTLYEPLAVATQMLVGDEELLYLVRLAVAGVKPLSRYERPLSAEQHEAIGVHGLLVTTVVRPTAWGHVVRHTVFSRDFARLGAYLVEFDRTPLRYDAEGLLHEGLHLGYPECCARHFAAHGFAPNGFAPPDQAILFHWACPQCALTAGLLPRYRTVWHEVQRLVGAAPARAARVWASEVF